MPRAVLMSSMGTGLGCAEWLLPVASGRSLGSGVVYWRRGRRLLLLPSKPLLPWSLEQVEELDTARGIEDMKLEELSPHCSLREGACDVTTCAGVCLMFDSIYTFGMSMLPCVFVNLVLRALSGPDGLLG